jgi:O-antigen/teichoic acid export membrane protein
VDFFTLRSIDLIILSRYGLAGLGLYTVASKLYLTIRQLLADTLLDVTLSALSKISDDQPKLRQAYLRLIFISSSTTLPFFGLIAALAPEITLILFGQKWAAAGTATTWLCILGAIEVVQYFNGAILGATGNPKSVLWINVIKLISGMFVLIFADAKSLSELTMFYVLSQIILSPTGFILAIRVTNTPVRNFLSQISPGMLSTVAAFLATFLLRSQLPMIHVSIYVKTAYLGAVFCVVFFTLLWITCAHRLLDEIKYIRSNSDKKHQLNGL